MSSMKLALVMLRKSKDHLTYDQLEFQNQIRKRGTGHDIFLIISYLGKTSCLF